MNTSELPHILHLVRWYPYPVDPMFGLFIRRHILSTVNHARSTVIFVRPDSTVRTVSRVESVEDGIREIRITYPEKSARALNALTFMRMAYKAAAEVHRESPVDLVHVHVLTRLGVVAWWMKKRFGLPYVITEHWSRYIDDRFSGTLRKWWTRRVVRDADALISVTTYLRDVMKRRGLSVQPTVIIPNVVDDRVFDVQGEGDYFIHVSCFQRDAKNVFGLIRAMGEAKSRGLDFRLLMVGVGETWEECREMVRSLDLEEHVEFPGLVEGMELGRLVGGAKALLLFSDHETGPVVVAEALVAGVPVISTEVGEVPRWIDATNGMVIKIRDGDALIRAMVRISKGEVEYDRQAIRQKARRIFGVDVVSEGHRAIYSKIIENGGRMKGN